MIPKPFILLSIAAFGFVATPAPSALAATVKKPAAPIDENPAVIAAKKKRDDAEKAYQAAIQSKDKTAIADALKAKDAAIKELTEARKAATKAAREAQNAPAKR